MFDLYIRVYFTVTIVILVFCLLSSTTKGGIRAAERRSAAGAVLFNMHIVSAAIVLLVWVGKLIFGDM